MAASRSSCPINFGLEIFGDQWSLLIVRDLVFNEKRTYGEFLDSAEGISTNILANRLAKLERAGIVSKKRPADNQRIYLYSLTEKGRGLVPVLYELILWGVENSKASPNLINWAEDIKKHKHRRITTTVSKLARDHEEGA